METSANFQARAIARIAAVLIGSSAAVFAADKVDIGKMQYESSCAVCHGVAGRGDGPLKAHLVRPVPDLTGLARNNNGVFPFDRVYQIIDGRQEVKTHGPREMPVWGRTFSMQSSLYFENYPPQDAESAVRSRILGLTEYVYRLQVK